MREAGRIWFDLRRLSREKLQTDFSIAFPRISTHAQFALGRGQELFKDSAPVIKLPPSATEDDHLALLAWLNSSAACFWMKQVSYPKATTNKDINSDRGDPATNRYEFAAAGMLPLPIPERVCDTTERRTELLALAREIERFSADRVASEPSFTLSAWVPGNGRTLLEALRAAEQLGERAFHAMVVLQEELDWLFYEYIGLCERISRVRGTAAPEERPFAWATDEAPAMINEPLRSEWTRRRHSLARNPLLRMLEDRMYKRPWEGKRGVFGHGVLTWDERVIAACQHWLLDQTEAAISPLGFEPFTMGDLERELLAQPKVVAVLELLAPSMGDNIVTLLSTLTTNESIPYLAAIRHTDTGLAKRACWEHTWALQRREEAGDPGVGDIPVPPKYDHEDYREARYWSLRGKLDVPRERFIAYPGAELDARAPVFGWAGWHHLQRARALAALYQRRKTDDGWDRDRLRPLLAGLQELLPWLTQWHNEPDAELDGLRQGDVWAEFLEGERAALGWSEDDLRAWRPSAPARKERAKKGPKTKAA